VPEIKSALAMTAAQTVLLENGVTEANPFAGGSGSIRVNLAAKAGLVLHETKANYEAANPGNGGDPATLNQPSMARRDCTSGCSFTRTFRSTRPHFQLWDLSLQGGLIGTVWPSRMFVWGLGERSVTVNIDTSAYTADDVWRFGKLVITPALAKANLASPTLRLPIAVSVPKPLILITEQTNLSGALGSQTLYPFVLPAGATKLVVQTSGGNGDLDLVVLRPNATTACSSGGGTNNELCTITTTLTAGTWNARLDGFTAYDGVTLRVSYTN
jgi:hypothetical protein